MLVLDPNYATIGMNHFKICDWKEFHGNVKQALPPNMPEPQGKEIDLRMFVDYDHAGDKKTISSRTGFMICLNQALIT